MITPAYQRVHCLLPPLPSITDSKDLWRAPDTRVSQNGTLRDGRGGLGTVGLVLSS